MQFEREERGDQLTTKVVDVVLVGMTSHWISVESRPERTIAALLVAQGRAFTKPVRFTHTGEVFPDFVLIDLGKGEVPREMFGCSDAEYLARKQEKLAYYDDRYGSGGGAGMRRSETRGKTFRRSRPPMRGQVAKSKLLFRVLRRTGS